MTSGELPAPMAVCESCWLLEHAHWEPDSMDESGNVLMKFKGVDVPEKVNDGSVEVCCDCGSITIAGIYDFRDPKKVFFFKNGDQPKFDLDILDYDGDDLP